MLGERIKALRKSLDLTQQEFAARIGMKRNSIAQVESGRSTSDQTIFSICREFNVSEEWLRNGTGDMFRKTRRNDEITAFFGDVLASEPDFRHRFISVLARMTPEEWKILERKITELAEEMKKDGQ